MASPLEQFLIKPIVPIKIGDLDASFTNSSLWMVLVLIGVVTFLYVGMRRRELVPGRWQSMAEMSYEFVANMVRDNAGSAGRPYFPFIFTLFMFVLFSNLFGMIPYSFTVTSHIIVTFAMALVVFIGVTIIGFVKHGAHFFSLFVPAGCPAWLLPLVVTIEVISYFVRPVSLSVRLFANMMAGHTMLKVFAGFVISLAGALGVVGGVVGILPILLIAALTGLEIGIAMLQAYVFALLSCIYLNDALHLHH
ncbi:F0F1 ATP synthase subunit A [Desertibaculum subflavum]|uniref:F0F1 ATP synthase subunit A n=1 Tax=Desertibaculum subflavum TaxID=2268458 RepID=UPI000E661463